MIEMLLSTTEGRVLAGLIIAMAILAAVMAMMIETTMYEGDDRFDVD